MSFEATAEALTPASSRRLVSNHAQRRHRTEQWRVERTRTEPPSGATTGAGPCSRMVATERLFGSRLRGKQASACLGSMASRVAAWLFLLGAGDFAADCHC